MSDKEEIVLNDQNAWRKEAEAVINDVKVGVHQIVVCETLLSSNSRIFLNVQTLENEMFCIELTSKGFRVVGKMFDVNDITNGQYYETPYALLDTCSPMFREAFSKTLANKLSALLSDHEGNEELEK